MISFISKSCLLKGLYPVEHSITTPLLTNDFFRHALRALFTYVILTFVAIWCHSAIRESRISIVRVSISFTLSIWGMFAQNINSAFSLMMIMYFRLNFPWIPNDYKFIFHFGWLRKPFTFFSQFHLFHFMVIDDMIGLLIPLDLMGTLTPWIFPFVKWIYYATSPEVCLSPKFCIHFLLGWYPFYYHRSVLIFCDETSTMHHTDNNYLW